jgi:hypothetical protein
VHGALGLVQRAHERALLRRAEQHHVASHWSPRGEGVRGGGVVDQCVRK